MEDVKTAELLPCPFCGDPMKQEGPTIMHVDQGSCVIGALAFDETRIDRWNRRAAAPAPQAVSTEGVARVIDGFAMDADIEVMERLCGGAQAAHVRERRQTALDQATAILALIPPVDDGSSLRDTHRAPDRAVLASLVAAVSVLEDAFGRGLPPNKVCGSDMMFRQMLADYNRAIVLGGQALRERKAAKPATEQVGIGAADGPKTPTEQAEGAVVGLPKGEAITNENASLLKGGDVVLLPDDFGDVELTYWGHDGATHIVEDDGEPFVVFFDLTDARFVRRPLNPQAPTPASVSPGTEGGQ